MDKERYFAEMRNLYYSLIGEESDDYEEADFISDLAEDGWPDYDKWLVIWNRLYEGGELTERERDQALAYFKAGEAYPDENMRLK